jgi:VCBS repeat-containing protein
MPRISPRARLGRFGDRRRTFHFESLEPRIALAIDVVANGEYGGDPVLVQPFPPIVITPPVHDFDIASFSARGTGQLNPSQTAINVPAGSTSGIIRLSGTITGPGNFPGPGDHPGIDVEAIGPRVLTSTSTITTSTNSKIASFDLDVTLRLGESSFNYDAVRTDGFRLPVERDNSLQRLVGTARINALPEAVDDMFALDEDKTLNGNVRTNDRDGDFNVSGADPDEDGNNLTYSKVSGPSQGSLMLNSNGTFTYTPNANFFGSDAFTYRVSDGFGSDTAQVNITVNPVNDPPFADPDSATTQEDTPVTINVLNGDSDVDGTIVASSVTVVEGPDNGKATENADGTVTYTPNANFNGTDSFQYQVRDNDGALSNKATVTVTVNSVLDDPIIGGAIDDVPLFTGEVGDGDLTNDNRPLLFGFSEADSTVTLHLNSATGPVLGSATADAANKWQVQVTTALPEGFNTFVAEANADNMTTFSAPFTLEIDTQVAIPAFTGIDIDTATVGDEITSDTTPDFFGTGDAAEPHGPLAIRITEVGTTNVRGTTTVDNDGKWMATFQGDALTTRSYVFLAAATDLAGNVSAPAALEVVIDTIKPVVGPLQVRAADRFGPTVLPIPVTDEPNPTFEFNITEQEFRLKDNITTIELFERQGASTVLKNTTTFEFPDQNSDNVAAMRQATTSGSFAPGPHTVFVRVTDAAGNFMNSPDFLFFAVNLQTQGRDTQGAPGTPIYNQFYDLFKAIQGNQPRTGTANDLWPWTVAFDNSTQTYWFTMEHGGKLGHFDPATSTVRVFDITGALPTGFDNPHGVFFDFDSHLTPRIWFVHRNAGGTNANVGGSHADDDEMPSGNGRLSYLDLAAVFRNADPARTGAPENTFFSYDLAGLAPNDVEFFDDTHAVFVDARGNVWVTSDHGDKILEFDFDQPNNLASTNARMWVHQVPDGLAPQSVGDQNFQPHALQVVVDDVTGEQYVWAISEGGSGRSLLLRPGIGSGGVDQWYSFGPGSNTPRAQAAVGARGTFVQIDDNETPGRPQDDNVVLTFPVGNGTNPNATAGVIQVLDPAQVFGVPTAAARATLRTWVIEAAPGQTPPNAATNQPFVDRSGTVFYVDRLGSVGRFAPDDFSDAEIPAEDLNLANGGILTATSSALFFPDISPSHELVFQGTLPIPVPTSMGAGPQGQRPDIAFQPGIDQYEVAGGMDPSVAQRGIGPFRGFLSAGQILFGTITQTEELSTTVFAETARRQMASVVSPTQLPAGVVRGRMAFQVLRDGRVILTGRGDGVIIDRQIDLTQLLQQNPANSAIPGLRMSGDPSATLDANGVVSVFGLADDGTLLVYQYRSSWAHDSLFNANNWTAFKLAQPAGRLLVGDPTAFTDSTGRAKAMVTTNDGHLVLFEAVPGSTAVDLFQQAGSLHPVYASVGVVAQGNRVFAHGTNQLGDLVQYSFLADNPNLVVATTVLQVVGLDPAQTGVAQPRDARVFQAVDAVFAGGKRHVFAMDGNSRLVHFEFDSDAALARVSNVTNLVAANNQTFGYFNFQQSFGGRAYTETSTVVGPDGAVYVYGTNGRDLVEFKRSSSGGWQAANLTNDIFSTDGAARTAGSRVGANEVFGAPTAYIQPDGERHILQINADGEVVEYFYTPQTSMPRFHTQNINLASGNDFSQSSQVSVTATEAGVLVVTGDGSANGLAITGTGAPGQYIVTGLDAADGTPTVVNGLTNGTITVEGVFTGIDINLGDGDDYVSLDRAFIGGSIAVRTGAGNDVVQVGTREIVTMRDDLVIDTGQGNDQLDLQRSYVVRHLVVDGGDGNDTLRPNNASSLRDFVLRSGNGADTLDVRQVAVVGSWLIDAGLDSDNISLTNSAATGAAAILGREGNDRISLEACFFNSSFFIDGDSGQDSVELSGVIANADAYLALGSGDDQAQVRHSIVRTLVLDGADGNDRADISTSLLDDLFASLGADDDHLSVLTNRIRRSHLLDGGTGTDEFLARSNDPFALTNTGFERKMT